MILKDELKTRLKNVRSDMEYTGINAMFISKPENVFYLTGKETGRVVLTRQSATVWVKGIYYELYREFYRENCPIPVRKYDDKRMMDHIRSVPYRKWALEDVSIRQYTLLKKKFKRTLVDSDIIKSRRAIKTRYEIKLMKKSGQIAKKGMLAAYKRIKEGTRELDAAAEVEFEIRKQGSQAPPFNEGIILAYGKNAADIHMRPTEQKIGNGLVVVDLGAKYGGYFSDMTRTINVGRISKQERLLSEFVENLKDETIDYVYAGMTGGDVHAYVQERIERAGYKFHHAVGHGVGLEIHENPDMHPGSDEILAENMVFTIEPGIYIPKKLGVRFEDTIYLGKNRVYNLTY